MSASSTNNALQSRYATYLAPYAAPSSRVIDST